MNTVKAIFIAPGAEPAWFDLPSDESAHYNNVKALVGGIIDCIGLGETPDGARVYAIINDEGLLIGLPPSIREKNGRLFVGNIIVTAERPAGGDLAYCDLPENAMQVVKKWLADAQRPGRFEYDIPPAQVFAGDEFEKAMRGEIPPAKPVGIVGFVSDDEQFIGTRR